MRLIYRERLTLVSGLHGIDDTAPSIHDAFPEGNDVVEHLVRAISGGSNSSSLLQNLNNNREISLKVTANSAGNVAETLEDGRLELVGKGCALV